LPTRPVPKREIPNSYLFRRSRVRRVIVGTHGADVHAGVKALLAEAGLVLEYEHEYNPLTIECDETARTGRQVRYDC